jgi:hypothetical protein
MMRTRATARGRMLPGPDRASPLLAEFGGHTPVRQPPDDAASEQAGIVWALGKAAGFSPFFPGGFAVCARRALMLPSRPGKKLLRRGALDGG